VQAPDAADLEVTGVPGLAAARGAAGAPARQAVGLAAMPLLLGGVPAPGLAVEEGPVDDGVPFRLPHEAERVPPVLAADSLLDRARGDATAVVAVELVE